MDARTFDECLMYKKGEDIQRIPGWLYVMETAVYRKVSLPWEKINTDIHITFENIAKIYKMNSLRISPTVNYYRASLWGQLDNGLYIMLQMCNIGSAGIGFIFLCKDRDSFIHFISSQYKIFDSNNNSNNNNKNNNPKTLYDICLDSIYFDNWPDQRIVVPSFLLRNLSYGIRIKKIYRLALELYFKDVKRLEVSSNIIISQHTLPE